MCFDDSMDSSGLALLMVFLFVAIATKNTYACDNAADFYQCPYGAVLVSRGRTSNNQCGLTDEVRLCSPPGCQIAQRNGVYTIQRFGQRLVDCNLSFLGGGSRKCIAWCRNARGGIQRGTYFCGATPIGVFHCGGCGNDCRRNNF